MLTSDVMKISPVGAELSHVDGRTDRKLIVAFRSFANAPKNVFCWCMDWIPYERFRVEVLCSSRRPLDLVP
jgi:hypothetical protein